MVGIKGGDGPTLTRSLCSAAVVTAAASRAFVDLLLPICCVSVNGSFLMAKGIVCGIADSLAELPTRDVSDAVTRSAATHALV